MEFRWHIHLAGSPHCEESWQHGTAVRWGPQAPDIHWFFFFFLMFIHWKSLQDVLAVKCNLVDVESANMHFAQTNSLAQLQNMGSIFSAIISTLYQQNGLQFLHSLQTLKQVCSYKNDLWQYYFKSAHLRLQIFVTAKARSSFLTANFILLLQNCPSFLQLRKYSWHCEVWICIWKSVFEAANKHFAATKFCSCISWIVAVIANHNHITTMVSLQQIFFLNQLMSWACGDNIALFPLDSHR